MILFSEKETEVKTDRSIRGLVILWMITFTDQIVEWYQFLLVFRKVWEDYIIIPPDEEIRNVDGNGLPILNDGELCFWKNYPGRCYCCIKNMTIGVIFWFGVFEVIIGKSQWTTKSVLRQLWQSLIDTLLSFQDSNIVSLTEDEFLWDKMMYFM